MDQHQRIAVGLREAADLTGLSVDTLYRAIRRGQLPAVRVGTRVTVRLEALELYIKDHEVHGGRRVGR